MMEIRSDIHESKIIIGCIRDSQVHLMQNAFQLIVSGLYDNLISLADAKFMAACDSTGSWANISNSQPLFGIDENGSKCFIKFGLVQPIPPAPVEEPVASSECVVTQDDCIDDCVADEVSAS